MAGVTVPAAEGVGGRATAWGATQPRGGPHGWGPGDGPQGSLSAQSPRVLPWHAHGSHLCGLRTAVARETEARSGTREVRPSGGDVVAAPTSSATAVPGAAQPGPVLPFIFPG